MSAPEAGSLQASVERCLLPAGGSGDAGPGASPAPLQAALRFPEDLPVFAGHFPGAPLVPGVCLLEAVRLACERAGGELLVVREVVQAKFTGEVGPGDTVEVTGALEAEAGGFSCLARVRVGARDAARFELRLLPRGGGARGGDRA